MTSTTGTTIEGYFEWLKRELERKEYGKVSIEFTVCRGQVTDVAKGSFDTDHIPLEKRVIKISRPVSKY